MGGIIIGYEIGRLLNKETIFSERVNKEFKLRRDFSIKPNQKILIIEDVITTGKSSLECSKLAMDKGASIVGYACLIDRSNGKSSIKDKIVSQVQLNIPTYTEKDLPKNLSLIEAIKPGSRNLLMKKIRLGVNIDHVATVRNARGEIYPSPLRAALLARKHGADSVTIHLREDRRHINETDLKQIKSKLKKFH